MKKRLWATLLAVIMVMAITPLALAAESGPQELNQETLPKMAEQDDSESTIRYWEISAGDYQLTSDINLDGTIEGATSISLRFEEGTSTLDLNGHSITSSNMAVITNKGTLTIKDSSTGQKGCVTGSRGVDNYGALTLDGGTIVGTGTSNGTIRFCNAGSFTMNAGKVVSDQTNAISSNDNYDSTITILGGEIGDISMTGGTLIIGKSEGELCYDIKVGNIKDSNKFIAEYTLKLYDGIIESVPSSAKAKYDSEALSALIIRKTSEPGGYHFESAQYDEQVYYKLVKNTKSVAHIGDTAYYYLPDAVAALQEDDTLTLLADYNITNSSEALTITVPGVTLDLNGHDITVTGDVSNPPVTCKAKTGTFKITNSGSKAATITPVTGKNYTVPAVQISSGSAATVEVDTENVNLTNGIRLTGGRIEDTPANRELVAVGGSYDGLCTIKFGDAEEAEGYIYAFGDLDAIVTQAGEGVTSATVTLLGDADTSIKYSTSKIAMTVDLAGHTVAASSGNSLISIPDNADKTNLTVKNGTINAQGISAASVLAENCVLTLENLSMTSGGDFGIATNGSAAGSDGSSAGLKLTLTNCSLQNTINSKSGTVGIYFPVHNGTLTINNSQITQFDMGVQAISGSTTITGDQTEITGSGRAIENDSGDGPRFDGAALSVLDREGYGDLATVKIEAGSFSTPADSDYGAVHVSGFKGNQFTNDFVNNAGNTQIVQVSGGTFTSSVKEYVTSDLKAELYSAGSGTYTYYKTDAAANADAKPGDAVSDVTSTSNYKVTVVYDNGTANQTITVGGNATYILPAAPTQPGYAFQGWLSSANNQTYQAGDTVTIGGNTTFTAQWAYIPPVITNPSYAISVPSTTNGTVTVNPASAQQGATVTITATSNQGYELASLTVTDGRGNAVAVQSNPNGTYSFVMPASQVTVSAVFVEKAPEIWVNPFVDVTATDWYYSAVEYACRNGLMVGTSAVTFDPAGTVTRGTVTTILARLAGVDTAGSNPWYQAGTDWAVANGVSDGTNPEGTITREQVATMLYRFAGSPAVSGDFLAGFADADDVADWARDAMNWAVSVGIITGGDAGLNPQGPASRAELATMLMRFCENVL